MIERLIEELSLGAKSSVELQEKLGLSQSAVSRLLRRAGPRVARIGRGRSTRYSATRPIFGSGQSLSVHAVDNGGLIDQIAVLGALVGGGYLVDSPRMAPWLAGLAGNGLFESLPYFLFDLRPAGFIGRQIARELAAEWGFPPDPRDWTDQHLGEYLLRRGADLPGNLVVGEAAVRQLQRQTTPSVTDRAREYPRLAERALSDEVQGSSAAGEQPKFAVHHRDAGHVIVKFSPSADTPDAARWRDLLHAEAHALAALDQLGVPTAHTSVYSLDGRVFLESRRFDREGLRGRRPALSLRMIDAEYAGIAQGWTAVASGLHDQGLLRAEVLRAIAVAETFGQWIGNTDMHLGNVSLAPVAGHFALLPLYDMLPMAFAPARGELPRVSLGPPIRTPGNRHVWDKAREGATGLWRTLASDDQLTPDFRELAEGHERRCRQVSG